MVGDQSVVEGKHRAQQCPLESPDEEMRVNVGWGADQRLFQIGVTVFQAASAVAAKAIRLYVNKQMFTSSDADVVRLMVDSSRIKDTNRDHLDP